MITIENCPGRAIEMGTLPLPPGPIIRSRISDLTIPTVMCFIAMVVVSGCDKKKEIPPATSEEVISQKSIAPKPSHPAITCQRQLSFTVSDN
jgi:hypothetical protein